MPSLASPATACSPVACLGSCRPVCRLLRLPPTCLSSPPASRRHVCRLVWLLSARLLFFASFGSLRAAPRSMPQPSRGRSHRALPFCRCWLFRVAVPRAPAPQFSARAAFWCQARRFRFTAVAAAPVHRSALRARSFRSPLPCAAAVLSPVPCRYSGPFFANEISPTPTPSCSAAGASLAAALAAIFSAAGLPSSVVFYTRLYK